MSNLSPGTYLWKKPGKSNAGWLRSWGICGTSGGGRWTSLIWKWGEEKGEGGNCEKRVNHGWASYFQILHKGTSRETSVTLPRIHVSVCSWATLAFALEELFYYFGSLYQVWCISVGEKEIIILNPLPDHFVKFSLSDIIWFFVLWSCSLSLISCWYRPSRLSQGSWMWSAGTDVAEWAHKGTENNEELAGITKEPLQQSSCWTDCFWGGRSEPW